MKKILLSLFTFFSFVLSAQAPQGINYQGVARTNAGVAMGSTNLGVKFKIWQGNPSTGTVIYSEVHSSVLTDTFGLYSLVIGSASGTGVGAFNSIPWGGGNLWVEVYIDPTNSGSFVTPVSAQQLMSVPYALYAQTSGSGGGGGVNGVPHNIPKLNPTGNGIKKSLLFERADSSGMGINNASPNTNAVLDIVNTGIPTQAGKGLLIPRMTGQERNAIPVTNLEHGLLVFQTNYVSVVSPEGLWYYDAVNSAWLLLAPAQAVWTLSGNVVGTNSFIGSLDNNDVVFKTGLITPTERMRIFNSTKGGNVQFGDGSTLNSYVFPASRGSAGQVLQMNPNGNNDMIWISPGSAAGWLTTGNVGTTGNFLGTTGAFPLVISTTNTTTPQPIQFLTAGVERMRIEEQNGFVGIGTNTPLAKFHVAANSTAGPQVYIQNTAANQEAAVVVTTPGGGGNIETVLSAVDGGTAVTQVGRVGTLTNNDLILVAGTGGSEIMRLAASGNVGIGINSPPYLLTVLGSQATTPIVGVQNTGGGDALVSSSTSGGAGVLGTNNGSGIGIAGYHSGTSGYAGYFQVAAGNANGASGIHVDNLGDGPGIVIVSSSTVNTNASLDISTAGVGNGLSSTVSGSGRAGFFNVTDQTNTSNALDVVHQGKGIVGSFANTTSSNSSAVLSVTNVGSGPSILATNAGTSTTFSANTTGTGSVASLIISNPSSASAALNVSTNGLASAANFQSTNPGTSAPTVFITNGSAAPSLQVTSTSNSPAIVSLGSGTNGAISAKFDGGAVAVGTGTANPTSGLDVKTSMGVSVKKYAIAGIFAIPPTDPNVVHIVGQSGTTTFTLPDAILCPGRMLIFTSDHTVTGGQMIIQGCCSQLVNGGASQTFSMISGVNKPSIGVVSDGNNWQIIFRN